MADRYIELICEFQDELQRELTLEEIQMIKRIVAKEFNYLSNCAS
jgi:hypothetical protein